MERKSIYLGPGAYSVLPEYRLIYAGIVGVDNYYEPEYKWYVCDRKSCEITHVDWAQKDGFIYRFIFVSEVPLESLIGFPDVRTLIKEAIFRWKESQ